MSDKRLGNLRNVLDGKESRPRLADVSPGRSYEPSATQTQSSRPSQPKPRIQKPQRTAQKSESTTRAQTTSNVDPRVRVVLRLNPELRNALSDVAHAKHVPFAAIVFEAVEQAHGSGTLMALLTRAEQDRPDSGLFSRPTLPVAQAKTTLELRMPRQDQQTLDRLVIEHKAANRTHLITAALSQYLLGAIDGK